MLTRGEAAMPGRTKISTAITRLLGIDHPILLAPMGGVPAVPAAGDLGLIAASSADPALDATEP